MRAAARGRRGLRRGAARRARRCAGAGGARPDDIAAHYRQAVRAHDADPRRAPAHRDAPARPRRPALREAGARPSRRPATSSARGRSPTTSTRLAHGPRATPRRPATVRRACAASSTPSTTRPIAARAVDAALDARAGADTRTTRRSTPRSGRMLTALDRGTHARHGRRPRRARRRGAGQRRRHGQPRHRRHRRRDPRLPRRPGGGADPGRDHRQLRRRPQAPAAAGAARRHRRHRRDRDHVGWSSSC